MKLEDFRIGKSFWSKTGCEYCCTDIGTRSVVAIEVDPGLEPGWYEGPPYRLPEVVFDVSEVVECRNRPTVKRATPKKQEAQEEAA